MYKRIMPDVVRNPVIHFLPPQATVREAAEVMLNQSVGVVLVMNGSQMCGIFSERDLATRVVAQGRNPETTFLAEVMTQEVATISPSSNTFKAIETMREHHCRHLPVVDGGEVMGMVSMRDLHRANSEGLAYDLQECRTYICSSY